VVQAQGAAGMTIRALAASNSTVAHVAVSMRPHHWVKNAFIFAPLIFSKKLMVLQANLHLLAGFLLFCLVSGCVYILNDVMDRDADSRNPSKRHRPIPAGKLPAHRALTAASAVAFPCVLLGFTLSREFGTVLSVYVLVNIAYSVWLKHVVIIDVFVIALGFFLRILAGIVLVRAETSEWVYVAAIFLTLFLGFGKRRAELLAAQSGESAQKRRVLDEYNAPFLDSLLIINASGVILSYMLYTVSDYACAKFGTKGLLVSSVFVLYGLMRYYYLLYVRKLGDSPAEVVLTDVPLLVSVILWALSSSLIIYR